jgi:D-alanyl-D-alanine carboxypeptidase (penicillin-binding protein 5/6)
MNRLLSLILSICLLCCAIPSSAYAAVYFSETAEEDLTADTQPDFGLTAKAACLMEASTGQIIYEDRADEQLSPASITKIMTLILIFDAIHAGKIALTDEVTTSAYAKSMGGSQVYLEEGEVQTVETLIKCIIIASGNDASVTMAEYLAGSESEFVRQMNERAKGLGMTNTNFVDCCGLTEDPAHVSSAKDVAIMSRELITKYPEVTNYSTIWMDTITHNTAQGSSEFGLSNTNKLLKMNTAFEVTGLKTGSTSLAKYCVSATAKKDGIELIAVIMASDNYKLRFSEAQTLLNYGYANCKLYKDEEMPELSPLPIRQGVTEEVELEYANSFSYLSTTSEDFSAITRDITYTSDACAPIEAGDVLGTLTYSLNGKTLGEVPILAKESVAKARYGDYLKRLLNCFRV